MDIQEFVRLRSEVERLQRDADRSAGALEQAMQRLQAEFGCSSLEQARKKLEKLKRLLALKEQQYEKRLTEFSSRYGRKLDSV